MSSIVTRARKSILAKLPYRKQRQQSGWLRLPEDATSDPVVKPTPYLPIYEQLLGPLLSREFTLLELGVWNGHSLQMWRDAFRKATIIGVDLQPPDVDLGYKVHIVEGDQTDASLMTRLREEYAPDGFDVIVDDASHIGITTARSLQALYVDHLRPGGLYCIEDWGTGYLPGWSDGAQLGSQVDIDRLDNPGESVHDGVTTLGAMPSHDAGVVGLIKRLVDHTGRGTVKAAQPDGVGEALLIESMTIWDGIVALRKSSP